MSPEAQGLVMRPSSRTGVCLASARGMPSDRRVRVGCLATAWCPRFRCQRFRCPQNLEEEAGCGQTDCRKMKKQAMAKRTADKEAGNGQATGLQKNFLEILLSQAHTHHIVVLSSCHIALL